MNPRTDPARCGHGVIATITHTRSLLRVFTDPKRIAQGRAGKLGAAPPRPSECGRTDVPARVIEAEGGSTRLRFVLAILLLVCVLPGCAVGPGYRHPDTRLPENWHEASENGLVAGEADVQEWWKTFNDDTLSSLIDRAAHGNLGVRIAVLRIREARALRGVAVGELLPSLSGSTSYDRSKASANGPAAGMSVPGPGAQFGNTVARGIATGAIGQGLGAAVPNAAGVTNSLATGLVGLIPSRSGSPQTDDSDLFATGFDASWEIDVFGGKRRNVQAAGADLSATVEDYRAVLVSLLAEVATTYIDLRALQSQISATKQNIELQKHTLLLTQSRFDAELTSELDVRQAQTNLATTESELPLLEAGLSLAIYRLGVLLGREPAALYDELLVEGPIPQAATGTFVGIPTDIIRRRPDIRAAERRLTAQTARIGVAAAELYPRFTLSGTFAFQATDFNHALDGRSISYGFGPAVRWNIFDGLRNLNRIAAQEAVAHQAYVAYEQTLLLALENVEVSMVAYKHEQDRYDALLRAVDAGRRTVHLAQMRYDDGLTDFQRVLDAQRSLVALENALAQSRGQVAVNLVALYKALGGGWRPDYMPQTLYLEAPSDALDNPLDFFLTGGKSALPWATESPEPSPTDATPAEQNGEEGR